MQQGTFLIGSRMSLLAILGLLVANANAFPLLNQKVALSIFFLMNITIIIIIINQVTNPLWIGPSGHSFDYGRQILSLYSSALTPALLKYSFEGISYLIFHYLYIDI